MPQGMSGWLTVIIQTLTIIGIVGGFLGAWLGRRFKEADEKSANARELIKKDLGSVTASCLQHTANISDLNRKMQASEFDRNDLRQNIGRVEATAGRNESELRVIREEMHQDQVKIEGRLSRIESKLDQLLEAKK